MRTDLMINYQALETISYDINVYRQCSLDMDEAREDLYAILKG